MSLPHEVDGYIFNAEKVSSDWTPGREQIRGTIFGDRKNRFPDGEIIRTSLVEKINEAPAIPRLGYAADVLTLNSRYRIINWRTNHG